VADAERQIGELEPGLDDHRREEHPKRRLGDLRWEVDLDPAGELCAVAALGGAGL
jgi:hypothetical protein